MCTANIKIFKNDSLIDFYNISNEQFDGVGDRYGLLIYNVPIKNHIIISKFGSYDGQNIIINKKGKKLITLGGFSSLDQRNGILFSIYPSDISGFSVFDLKRKKLKKTEIQMSSLKDMKLKELVDYTGIKIECQ